MNWKVIKTEKDYIRASKRLMKIFHVSPSMAEFDEMELLTVLVKDYDDKHYIIAQPNPLDAIKFKMEELGIKAKDLQPLIGSKGYVSSILSGRKELTFTIAKKLKDYFQLPAEIFFPA